MTSTPTSKPSTRTREEQNKEQERSIVADQKTAIVELLGAVERLTQEVAALKDSTTKLFKPIEVAPAGPGRQNYEHKAPAAMPPQVPSTGASPIRSPSPVRSSTPPPASSPTQNLTLPVRPSVSKADATFIVKHCEARTPWVSRSEVLRGLIATRPAATGEEILEEFIDMVCGGEGEDEFQVAFTEGLKFLIGAGFQFDEH